MGMLLCELELVLQAILWDRPVAAYGVSVKLSCVVDCMLAYILLCELNLTVLNLALDFKFTIDI